MGLSSPWPSSWCSDPFTCRHGCSIGSSRSWRPHRPHSHCANGYGHDVDCIVLPIDAHDLNHAVAVAFRQSQLGAHSHKSDLGSGWWVKDPLLQSRSAWGRGSTG
eukprot:737524-Amphidinium_carterae.1